MSPELIKSLRERIVGGESKEATKAAVLAEGYTPEVFEAAYTLASHDEQKVPSLAEPAVFSLIQEGFQKVITQPIGAILMAIPMVVTVLATAGKQYAGDTLQAEIALTGLIILALIAYFFAIIAALFLYTRPLTEQVTMNTAIAWAIRHVLPLGFIYILVGLIVWGGFVFFLVPGMIVLVTTYFAQFIYLDEGAGGMHALLRSRVLVTDRWWLTARKIGGVLLLVLIPAFLLSILQEVVRYWSGNIYLGVGFDLLIEAVVAFVTAITIGAMFPLYQYLKATRPIHEETSILTKTLYWFLVVGGVLMAAMIAIVVSRVEDFSAVSEELVSVEAGPDELVGVREAAEVYGVTHNDSFEDVCSELVSSLTTEGEVECNDEESAWALQINSVSESWCIDADTAPKRLETKLEDRTHCLALP